MWGGGMEYYSVMKKNEIFDTSKWTEQENKMLSEVSQVEKDKNHVFSYMWKIDPNTTTSISIYTHICVYTEHVSKSGTVRGD
jgi:spore germination protein GerM